ncbi:MAG: ABC transporter ATP-binding protein [Candidatus Lokiarchaeota archaeon]|nr:ABC transporter ATP-binding protein [Candidatus Lokiarchaeota archaeon]
MNLIKFSNFYYRYKGNEEYALKDINLEITNNKFILLAGETGSGKTSLIRCMNGLIPQFYSGYYKGAVVINGKDTNKTPISELSTEIGIVFQNPENQLVAMNVEHEIVFGMENLGFPKEKIHQKMEEVIRLTEIEKILNKAPFEISGGEQQRVAIASVLVLDPKIIILDEPTANLDPLFANKILQLLKKIQKERNITIIISEHRMDLIFPLIDEIILIDKGEIISHDSKLNVVNSLEFKNLQINKPRIYSIFNELKQRKLYNDEIPFSIEKGIQLLKTLI